MTPYAYRTDAPLSAAELSAAALDGELWRVTRTAYASALRPGSALSRAEASRDIVPGDHAAVRTTAAWIHGALPAEPDPHHIQQLADVPSRRHWRGGVIAHSWPVPRRDVQLIGGVHVTTVERTYYDVGRAVLEDPDDRGCARAMSWFQERAELHSRIRTWLAQGRRLRFTGQLSRLLSEPSFPADQDVVAR